jgi:dihydroorotase
MGTTGLETAFAAVYTRLVLGGELDLPTLVERMTAGAAVFDLPIPTVALDEVASVCVVDLEASLQVGGRGYVSRSENCCFHGQTFRGRVLLTVAGGSVAFRAPALADSAALAAVK